jgi:hypothetical protein
MGEGRRWYDTSRVLAAMMAIVLALICSWAAIVWNCARGAEITNCRQDEQIGALQKSVDKIDGKLDRILERLPHLPK